MHLQVASGLHFLSKMLVSGERWEHGMRFDVQEQFLEAQWQLGKAMPLVHSGQCVEALFGIGGIKGR